jgi:hypothetical protein
MIAIVKELFDFGKYLDAPIYDAFSLREPVPTSLENALVTPP